MDGHSRRHQLSLRGGRSHASSTRDTASGRRTLAVCVCAVLIVCVIVGMQLHSAGRDPAGTSPFEGSTGTEEWTGQTSGLSAAEAFGTRDNDGLVDACTEVLERYEKESGCTLVHAGYIDLFGNVWACLVMGPGWAELSVVRVGKDGVARTSVAHIGSASLPVVVGDAR